MKTADKKLYEGMFLIDSVLAEADMDGIIDTIQSLLERSSAEIESIKNWDSRKLAYKIQGKQSGTYILSYFRVDGAKLTDIERDVALSERIMRVLILNTDARESEELQKETPIERAERKERQAMEKAAGRVKEPTKQEPSEGIKQETEQEKEAVKADDGDLQSSVELELPPGPEQPPEPELPQVQASESETADTTDSRQTEQNIEVETIAQPGSEGQDQKNDEAEKSDVEKGN
ncbi:30S ribosomal protein S6 [Planctomycetota bacterium]